MTIQEAIALIMTRAADAWVKAEAIRAEATVENFREWNAYRAAKFLYEEAAREMAKIVKPDAYAESMGITASQVWIWNIRIFEHWLRGKKWAAAHTVGESDDAPKEAAIYADIETIFNEMDAVYL